MTAADFGKVEMADCFALVEVPDALADTTISALRATTIRGKKPTVRRESDRGSARL